MSVFSVLALSMAFAVSANAQYKSEPTSKSESTSSKLFAPPTGNTIVDVAIAANAEGPFAGQFDTLIAAVLAADPIVFNTLTRNGQFTVFAPTDDAFGELGLDDTNIGTLGQGTLTKILAYHVAPGRRYSDDVLDSYRIRTISKEFIFQNGGILTDAVGRDIGFVATDVEARNGVIHAVNGVLLPFLPTP